eukprot:1362462-Amorphochlora_amoeboformis.AAC.2
MSAIMVPQTSRYSFPLPRTSRLPLVLTILLLVAVYLWEGGEVKRNLRKGKRGRLHSSTKRLFCHIR